MEELDTYEMQKYEIISYKAILKWEKQKVNYFSKAMGVAITPIYYLVDKIGQKNIEKIEKTVGGVIEYIYKVSELTVSHEKLMKRLTKHGIILNELTDIQHCYLKQLDDCNLNYINIHGVSAAIQGGIAGITGELAAPVDLSALLVRIFNMIQYVALCYGFNPNDPIEKEIILSIMLVAFGGTELKRKILKEICHLRKKEQENRGDHYTHMLTKKATERTVKRFCSAILLRLFSRIIPIVSIVISAHSNYEMTKSSYEAAFMIYRKHFLERKTNLKKYLVISQSC